MNGTSGSGALALGLAMAAAMAAPAAAQCLPSTCPFTVSGKKGAYLLTQVRNEDLVKADAEVATGTAKGLSLGTSSVNQGQITGAGISMPQTEARLRILIDKVRASWPSGLRTPPPLRVRILGISTYAPLAHPDGVITIPIGLIDRSKSDDDVVWALGHEFSHVALAHFGHEAEQNKLISRLSEIVDCARMGIQIAQVRVDMAGNQINMSQTQDPRMQAMSLQIWSRQHMLDDALQGFKQHMTRKQEDVADAAGFDLAHAAGYSRDGYTDALNELAREEENKGNALRKFTDDLGTFSKQSGEKAGAKAATSILSGGGISGVTGIVSGLGSTIFKNGESMALSAVRDEFMADHRPAKKRREGMDKYADTAYPGTDPDAQTGWITAVKALPEYQTAISVVGALDNALGKIPGEICAGDDRPCHERVIAGGEDAVRALQPALNSPYRNTPLVADTLGKIYFLLHRYAEADRAYSEAEHFGIAAPQAQRSAAGGKGKRRAAAIAPAPMARQTPDPYLEQSADGYADHLQTLLRMKNYPRAMSLVTFAKEKLGDDERFLPALVTIALHTNNAPMFMETIQRCSASGNIQVKRECNLSMMEADKRDAFENLDPRNRDKLYDGLDQASAELRKTTACGLKETLDKTREGAGKLHRAEEKAKLN